MCGLGGNPLWNPDKSGLDLAAEDKERVVHVWVGGWTCLINAFGIRSGTRICLILLGTLVRRLILIICISLTHPIHLI
jgi:hypothetical protein